MDNIAKVEHQEECKEICRGNEDEKYESLPILNKEDGSSMSDSNMDSNSSDSNSSSYQLNALPDEMLEFILTYLPPYKDLKNCSLVCKRWRSIVKNLIRRSKMNLHKGLIDFRLRWEIFSPQSAGTLELRSCIPKTSMYVIAGRFSHSAVRYSNYMYVFGGGSSSDTTFNDLWRFDLSKMHWERPFSMGTYPSPKGSASMVCWQEQLILFGGWRYPSLHPPHQPWCLFDELHYYDLIKNRWTVAITTHGPPPMAGHSASIHGDIMVIFGGYQMVDGVNLNSNQVWCLDLHKQYWWRPRLAGNVTPPPRYGQIQLVLDDHHLLIVGGCGGPNSVFSDAWILDMSSDLWLWKSVPVRNKKFAASHMWCNPACKIDSKLVVLGPTPNMPQDFQLMRQARIPVGGAAGAPNNRNRQLERQRWIPGEAGNGQAARGYALRVPAPNRPINFQLDGLNIPLDGPDEQYLAQRRAILNNHQQNASNNNFVNQHNNRNNNVQPRTGSLRNLHKIALQQMEEKNHNRPSSSGVQPRSNGVIAARTNSESSCNGEEVEKKRDDTKNSDMEAANRLQRNLSLRCRENEPFLPKRFDELYEDPFRMAAFNVQNRPRSLSKDHNERIRRMEEKMNALRNSRRNAVAEQKPLKEPSPKRAKRNVLSLFVCDLSNALSDDPHLQWVEHKNYGILPGAPERLILSTMVPGNGELVLFGGVQKETLYEMTHQVSNSVHFLSAPKDIV
uniref:F-box domain-containing protein n=1 Tax=Glossina palpalis gambiensis TaxID=67801 RepID=A0A1B0C0K1_9MUSC